MLRIAVSLACGVGVAGGAVAQTLPTINVTGWYGSEAIYLGGDVGDVSNVWSWNGSGGSDVSPPYGNANGAAPVCAVLATYGRPADCDRSKVGSGIESAPSVTQPDNWSQLGMSNRYNEYDLYRCYRDPSNQPSDCEYAFKMNMFNDCLRWYNPIYAGIGSPYDQCTSGINPVSMEITYARAFRDGSEYFQLNLSPDIGWFEVNVNAPWLSVMFWSPFNRMLLQARRSDACTRWYNTWDGLNCSSYYDIG